MKYLGNSLVFVIAYIILMIPTYILPWLGSNSAVLNSAGAAAGQGVSPQFIVHITCLLALIAITWFRGSLVGKKWIVIFPILATVFDMVPFLNLIPFVPTVMHIIVIIKGVSESPQVQTA